MVDDRGGQCSRSAARIDWSLILVWLFSIGAVLCGVAAWAMVAEP